MQRVGAPETGSIEHRIKRVMDEGEAAGMGAEWISRTVSSLLARHSVSAAVERAENVITITLPSVTLRHTSRVNVRRATSRRGAHVR
jgi:hypothetical protein